MTRPDVPVCLMQGLPSVKHWLLSCVFAHGPLFRPQEARSGEEAPGAVTGAGEERREQPAGATTRLFRRPGGPPVSAAGETEVWAETELSAGPRPSLARRRDGRILRTTVEGRAEEENQE